MTCIEEYLNGIKVIRPDVFIDKRGFFMESYNASSFKKLGIPTEFVQDNHSQSSKGVIRGMHFQWNRPMGKFIRVIRGSIQLVEVDIRFNSPTLGEHINIEINDQNNLMVWIPPGFANGFQVLSDVADVFYKCTTKHNPIAESGIHWNSFGMKWNDIPAIVSPKDESAQTLEDWLKRPESKLFKV